MYNKRYLQQSTLFKIPINAAVSQAVSPFCVCIMKGTPGVSHVTCHDIPIWLKNEVSSHSNIGHCFAYPQHMFWLRNKKNNIQLHTLIWGPVATGSFMRSLSEALITSI